VAAVSWAAAGGGGDVPPHRSPSQARRPASPAGGAGGAGFAATALAPTPHHHARAQLGRPPALPGLLAPHWRRPHRPARPPGQRSSLTLSAPCAAAAAAEDDQQQQQENRAPPAGGSGAGPPSRLVAGRETKNVKQRLKLLSTHIFTPPPAPSRPPGPDNQRRWPWLAERLPLLLPTPHSPWRPRLLPLRCLLHLHFNPSARTPRAAPPGRVQGPSQAVPATVGRGVQARGVGNCRHAQTRRTHSASGPERRTVG